LLTQLNINLKDVEQTNIIFEPTTKFYIFSNGVEIDGTMDSTTPYKVLLYFASRKAYDIFLDKLQSKMNEKILLYASKKRHSNVKFAHDFKKESEGLMVKSVSLTSKYRKQSYQKIQFKVLGAF
jgi:hypothetical protein